MAVREVSQFVRAASLPEVLEKGRLVVGLSGHTVCLIADGESVHAVDNRCPHMGFPLLLAKAAITLTEADPSAAEAFRTGLDFGAMRRGEGWGRGLTTLTCFMNLVPALEPADVPIALYHGLADVAEESAGDAPRFPLDPLPSYGAGPAQLGRWLR